MIIYGHKKTLASVSQPGSIDKKLGGDLLSHTLAYSTIGDEELDF